MITIDVPSLMVFVKPYGTQCSLLMYQALWYVMLAIDVPKLETVLLLNFWLFFSYQRFSLVKALLLTDLAHLLQGFLSTSNAIFIFQSRIGRFTQHDWATQVGMLLKFFLPLNLNWRGHNTDNKVNLTRSILPPCFVHWMWGSRN